MGLELDYLAKVSPTLITPLLLFLLLLSLFSFSPLPSLLAFPLVLLISEIKIPPMMDK